jgi:multiple sugar transport system substrate-binding protein
MFKKVSVLLVIILAALALSGAVLAQDDPYANVDPTGQTVVFWYQHSGQREAQLQQIIADFNATNEWGITVEGINQGSYSDIYARVTTDLAGGGDLPELVVAYGNQAATYFLNDGVIDINLLVNSPTWGLSEEEQADFFPSFFNADVFPQYGNVRLGFPPNRSMEVMYYNIDWLRELREAGAISFDGPPTTPEQFREAACAATANAFSGATSDVANIGYQLSTDASRFASWTFAFGGDIFDYDANQYTLNSPAAVEAVTFLKGLFEDGCAGEIFERFGDQTNFGNGVTLFTVGSSSGIPFYASAVEAGAGFDWSVAAVPHVTEQPVQNIYGASVSIPRTTPEQELAAWLFVKYYTSPEVQARWALASQYFPVRQSALEVEELATFLAEDETYSTAFGLLEFTKAEPSVPGYDPVRDQISRTLTAIVTGTDTRPIQEILDELNEFANEELEAASRAL